MALSELHKQLFRDECSRLMLVILGDVQKLDKNPTDLDTIESMVNLADIVRGDAKFLQDKDLEFDAKMLIEFFKGVKDVRERQKEFNWAKERFSALVDENVKLVLESKADAPLNSLGILSKD